VTTPKLDNYYFPKYLKFDNFLLKLQMSKNRIKNVTPGSDAFQGYTKKSILNFSSRHKFLTKNSIFVQRFDQNFDFNFLSSIFDHIFDKFLTKFLISFSLIFEKIFDQICDQIFD